MVGVPKEVGKGGDRIGTQVLVFKVQSLRKIGDQGFDVLFELLIIEGDIADCVDHILLEVLRVVDG